MSRFTLPDAVEDNRATDVRSALRNQSERDNRNDGVGFRLALVRNSSSTTPSVPPTVTAP